ncbi:MAG TPA: ankyrin repeat domain-containing protein [Thermoanaerobaculia bacterium]
MKKLLPLLASLCLAAPLSADQALGTLTVKGKTTALHAVAASEQTDPKDASQKWLVILASDKTVAEADRTVARLTELANTGKLHAVRILWRVGQDAVYVAPYDPALPQSGRRSLQHPTINLRAYGSGKLDAEFESKMLGQVWHFHANVKAKVAEGGVLELEPEADLAADFGKSEGAASGGKGGAAGKAELGQLGYSYDEKSFYHAIADGNLSAVQLFLQLGMSPNAHAKGDLHPMILSSQLCSNQPESKPRSDVLIALVNKGGDVKAKDENGSTPLLWAVQGGCSPAAVQALLKAGADPNAKAKAGATPLMFAEIFNRTEIAEILRKAGAKK